MSKSTPYPPLEIDDSTVAWIRGTRYKVIHLASEHYVHGWTAEELMRQHPDLVPEQVYAALAYFYEHKNEIVAQLKKSANCPLPLATTDLSREVLKQRLKTAEP
jgi:uncharacterized protein (DUF433 family)